MRIKNLLVAALAMLPAIFAAGQGYVHSSVLKQGNWIRLAVTEPGIFRIDYSQIRDMGFTDLSAVTLYGNNTGQLSFYNDGSAPDDLRKIAFKTETGSDGIFNEGDYLLFYAEGTHRWIYDKNTERYKYKRHYYSDTAWYFITSMPGDASLITGEQTPSEPYNQVSSSGDVRWRHEEELINLISSGREWYQQIVPGTENNISPPFENLILTEKIKYNVRVLGRSDTESSFTLRQGSTELKTITVPPVNLADLNGVYATIVVAEDSCLPASSTPSFTLTFGNNGNLAATGYIDYVDFFARAQLKYTDKQLFITDSRSVAASGITRFTVSGSSSLQVWDVTDPFAPKILETSFAAGNTVFTAATDSLRKFVAFTAGQVMRPIIDKDPVPNQDLHSAGPADMIIVTHPLFEEYARRLAEIHMADDGTTSIIVTPGQIYNEFSGGIPDAAAIRNFVRMVRDRGIESTSPLKYLLLFGDGSYENKTPPPQNTSYIPTWQSENSHVGVLSFTSDDFYGLLDDGEGEADGFLDIGIGRLPADDTAAAGVMVRKVASYLDSSALGSWRNILCMVADDEDSNLHMMDAESLTAAATEAAPPLVTEKIYLDAFRQVTTVTGDSYPDVVKAINDRIAEGCLIFNYVGHGNESGLAHERVVRTNDINSWKNKNMLPLFITATCEFSRFDDVDINQATRQISAKTSAGEMVLLNADGGGIALMSTTRVVYSAPNFTLNRNIYDYAFVTAPDGRSMRLGDIIRLAKINSGPGMNKRNFLLLGDPALRLAWPVQGKVVTDSINKISVEFATDTLKALSLITISGHIENKDGDLMTGFNGVIEPVVYDKASSVSTLANDGGSPMTYPVTGNVIFRGTTTVSAGNFSFSFIVPLDINYSFGKGSVTYYAHDGTADVNGNYSQIIVGGFSDININDTEGPVIRLFMNDTLFNDGGITDTSPSLLALISDESGINATGSGIGHDIIAWIDDDMEGAVVLNSLFGTDTGVHTSGSLTYPFIISEKGEHTLSLRAWDNLNNPSVSSLRFVVVTGGAFRLTNLLCYPNPVTGGTKFTAEHNRPDAEINVTITIFSTDGRAVKVIKEQVNSTGYSLPDIPWNGCDENGGRLTRGLYLWRAEAVTAEGETASAAGRVIIL
ncbi:MAG: type IX secretion system sortase PorU [Bacteroidales bacterium]